MYKTNNFLTGASRLWGLGRVDHNSLPKRSRKSGTPPFIALLLLLALLVGCAPVMPAADSGTTSAAAPVEPAADAVAETYIDPQGLFSVPIPTSWTANAQDGYVVLSSPNEGIQVYVLALQAESAEAAIEQAWQIVDPAFAQPVAETLTPPASDGIEAITLINYQPDEANGRYYQATARLYDDTFYLQLFDGNITDIQQRAAQINIIDSGFTIRALAETDLAGIDPLPVREVIPELERFIEEGLALMNIPGAAVAVVQDGEIVYSNGFGVTEQGGDTPITPQTHMLIGSTGKTMTTMLMATLVDEGKMSWDTPVVEVLPQFQVSDPVLSKAITLRNLVCACTGVPRRDYEWIFNANDLTAEDVVDSLATFEFFTDFGEAFQYSNQMVGTGGYAAAAADGAAFGNLLEGYGTSLQDNVLAPIGMENTTVSFEQVRERNHYALPHGATLGGMYNPLPLPYEEVLVPIAPAGAHWSTLEDMSRYMLTELAVGVAPDGTRVVSEENLRETWQPQVPVGADVDYGLGWFIDEYKGLELIHHGGNTLGFTSGFGFLPEAGLGIIVLTNGERTNTFNDAVRTRLLELVFEQEPEAEAGLQFAAELVQERAAQFDLADAVDATAVAPHLGTYSNEALGELTLRLEGEMLLLDVGEFAVTLLPEAKADDAAAPTSYIAMDAPFAGFHFALEQTEAGETVVRFLSDGAEVYTFERVE